VSLLLDTQIVLWWLNDSAELQPQTRELISTAEQEVFVSKASLWEIVLKASSGKLRADVAKIAREIPAHGFGWLDIATPHILAVGGLPRFDDHKDPFDRLLVAQSLTEPMILLTTDAKLARYGSTVRVL